MKKKSISSSHHAHHECHNADKLPNYKKMIGDIAGPEPVLFLVTFDAEGKVIAYDTVKEHYHYLH